MVAGNRRTLVKLPQLHEVKPRETVGRDVVARFQAQFRGAAIASLRILDGKSIDRVYCDYQDDFVIRETNGDSLLYHFFQVKTKALKKHQWSRLELFGIAKTTPSIAKGAHRPGGASPKAVTDDQLKKMRGSFVGKLLDHTIRFSHSCGSVNFLTNTHLSDEVDIIAEALAKGDVGERTVRYLADNLSQIYGLSPALPMSVVHGAVKKLRLSAENDYVDPHHDDFDTKAIKMLWQYSEIDLTHTEGCELVEKLLALVQEKSSSKLVANLDPSELDERVGIGVDDLLELLPISKGAYYTFMANGDGSALKNSSILQRKLSQAGASPDIIEAASHWKVRWDNWFRTHRHTYEHDLLFLQHQINEIYLRWARGDISFLGLRQEVLDLQQKLDKSSLPSKLDPETLLGGILAELVRVESK